MNKKENSLNNFNIKIKSNLKEKTNQNPSVAICKKERGITLISLVVTIVVLIILATISINAILGENGIIRRAEQARQHQANAEASDNAAMDELADYLANAMAEPEKTEKIAVPGQKVTGENANYTDNTGTAIIPVGFAVVIDPDTIANGLVISDVENDDMANSKGGNQFVWIPVPDYSKFHLIEGYYNGSLQTYLSKETNPSREAGASLTEILPGKPNSANTVLGTAESVAMYKSVEDNKGFYIARFEAGIENVDDEGNPVDNDSLETKVATDGSVKPLSKKGVGVWNSIAWGGTITAEASDGLQGNDSANGAVKVARSMYTKSSTCGAQSTLCYGVQWDAVMNFIDSNYYTGTCADDSFVKNSDQKGNHTGSLEETGYYEVNHIYDLAGNVNEWTMEAYDSSGRVCRGGGYGLTGSEIPASKRNGYSPGDSSIFRRSSCSFVLVTLSPC